ncbi:MAG: HD domain-containing protein [Anaerolineae bacterium]|nr:HD domain-containing protein [Anaerolineae bacterium]
MEEKLIISTSKILFPLSSAMDMVSPQLSAHQLRTAYIAWEIGKALQYHPQTISKIFNASLLHDIGALTPEEKIRLHNFEVDDPQPHCILGEFLFNSVRWLRPCAQAIRYHHRPWNEWVKETLDETLWQKAQTICLADYVERLIDRSTYILHQNRRIISEIKSLSGVLFAPQIVDGFLLAAGRENFWLMLTSPRLYTHLLQNGPHTTLTFDIRDFTQLATLLRNIIDFRTPFTATHSTGVAACAQYLARKLELTKEDIKRIHIAGNLHDLGKLSVPNTIIEKPATLTEEEYAIMKQHVFYTFSILNELPGFESIRDWASFHHETLNGIGYPFHLSKEELPLGARIISVADNFTAMIETRPYRPWLNQQEIVAVLRQKANEGLLDPQVVDLLITHYDELEAIVERKQAQSRQYYQQHFASLVNRNRSSAQ